MCKKLQIEFVQAVVGFEKGAGGSHPMIKGVVIFKKDKKGLLGAVEEFQELQKKKEEEKEIKMAK